MNIESNVIKEELNKNIVRISSESFNVVKSPEGVKVVGLALPFETVSRNNFTYVTESVKKAHQTMEQKSCLFNHNPDAVIGHVKNAPIESAGMGYQVDVNPNAINPATGVKFAESIERGDIKKVSIQCMYDSDKSFIDESGVTHAWIKEFLELSFVTIPGFEDTTAYVVESFKAKRQEDKMPENNQKENVPAPAEPPKQEENKESPPESKTKEQEEPKDDPVKVIMDRCDKIEGRLAAIEKYVQEQTEPEEKPDEDEKREEAIKNGKTTVAKEAAKETDIIIRTSDIKKMFMK